MEKINILLVPCDTEIAYEIFDSLRYHKYFNLILACHDKQKKYIFDHVYYLPFETDSKFYSELNSLIAHLDIKFIIPANDNLAYEISKNAHKINCKLLTHTKEVHEIIRFKDKTYDFFNGLISCPIVYEIKDLKEEFFPIFVKPKKGQGSTNAMKFGSIKEFQNFFINNNIDDYVCLEYLPFDEFTIDCFAHNGKLLYFLARKREKMFRGTSIITSVVRNEELNNIFKKNAQIISETLNLSGIFFFQMKFDKNYVLKLLEIGGRVPGSLALNRALGINLVEVSIYQALGLIDENSVFYVNPITDEVTLFRQLDRKVKAKIDFENLYVDYDDTLITPDGFINLDVIKFIFHAKNNNKKVYLITKNEDKSIYRVLNKYGIFYVFDEIIHITKEEKKVNFFKPRALLIDDSFFERKEAIERGFLAYAPNNVHMLISN